MGKHKLKPHHAAIVKAKQRGASYSEIGRMYGATSKAVVDYFARIRLHAPIVAPNAAERYIPARRRCLMCDEWFDSEWAGHRVCPSCQGHARESEPDVTYGRASQSRSAMRGRS